MIRILLITLAALPTIGLGPRRVFGDDLAGNPGIHPPAVR
jgi:hypothetical protein